MKLINDKWDAFLWICYAAAFMYVLGVIGWIVYHLYTKDVF